MHQLLLLRRNTLLAEQMLRFPTVVDDLLAWGWPSSLWPLPKWKRWRVDVWWYCDDNSQHYQGWHIEETMWFSQLPDLRALWSTRPFFFGLTNFMLLDQFCMLNSLH